MEIYYGKQAVSEIHRIVVSTTIESKKRRDNSFEDHVSMNQSESKIIRREGSGHVTLSSE